MDACEEDRCDLNAQVLKAASDFAAVEPLARSVLVKHGDGELELITLYVAKKEDSGAARLIDVTGKTYTDLEDFRSGNDLLDHSDTMLTLRNLTSVPGGRDLVVVSGHTASTWQWWLLGGVGALVLTGFVIRIVRLWITPLKP